MMLVNAFGVYGILASYGQQEWGVLVFLVITLIIVDYVYFSKRAIPGKYLVPGLIFLAVFQIYVMINTAYVAFTNYGDGHNDAKEPAITHILKTSDRRVEGTPEYQVTVFDRNGQLGFAIVEGDQARIGDAEVSCEYRVYPYVERLTVQRGGVRSRRFFGAGVFSAPVLRGLPADDLAGVFNQHFALGNILHSEYALAVYA